MIKLSPLDTPARGSARRAALSTTSLFSGIGGFELGLAKEGHKAQLLCELDPVAKSVLRERFPGTELISDVSELASLPSETDLVCAGFPCQNLSMAGDKRGIAGPKSSLVDHVFRLVDGRRVPWVLFENVYFMLHLDGGKAMEHIIGNLERRGMMWAYRVLNTRGFGLPQRRRRVFLIASRDLDPREVILSDDSFACREPTVTGLHLPIGFYWTEGRSGVGLTADGIPPLKSGSGLGIPSAPAVLFPDGSVETPKFRKQNDCRAFQRIGPLRPKTSMADCGGGCWGTPSPSRLRSGSGVSSHFHGLTIVLRIGDCDQENVGLPLPGVMEAAGFGPWRHKIPSASFQA